MQRGEPREDERALAALARLHGIQRSYVDTHDRRIRASREAILATLGAAVASRSRFRSGPSAPPWPAFATCRARSASVTAGAGSVLSSP